MDSALDLIFDKEEETLEEFQQNISTLSSREWINGSVTNHVCDPNSRVQQNISRDMLTDGAKSTGDNSNEEEGDISCEELDVGISTGSQMMFTQNDDSIMPKVDNFIDINDGDSNESDEKSLCSLSDLEEAEGPSFSNHVDYAPSSEELSKRDENLSLPKERCRQLDDPLEINDEVSANLGNHKSDFNVMILNQVSENDQLPGEADVELKSLPSLEARVTNIAIKTKVLTVRDTSNINSEGCEDGVEDTGLLSSDRIEEFVLDEDFDYDNVELTPKFLVKDEAESN